MSLGASLNGIGANFPSALIQVFSDYRSSFTIRGTHPLVRKVKMSLGPSLKGLGANFPSLLMAVLSTIVVTWHLGAHIHLSGRCKFHWGITQWPWGKLPFTTHTIFSDYRRNFTSRGTHTVVRKVKMFLGASLNGLGENFPSLRIQFLATIVVTSPLGAHRHSSGR